MNRGFFFALLTAMVWGLAPILEKAGLAGRVDPYLGVVIRSISITVLAVAGLLVMGRGGSIASVDLRSAFFIGAGGVVAGLIGQFLFYSALKTGEASVVVPVAATYPLVALLVSVLFLGEALTWQKLGGIGMVVGGVMLLK
jgi:transporter family protein